MEIYKQNNDITVSVIILLDIYVAHKCLLLMAYITVWDGRLLFFVNVQRCAIYQDR